MDEEEDQGDGGEKKRPHSLDQRFSRWPPFNRGRGETEGSKLAGQTIIDIVEKREFNRTVNLDSHADKWKEVKTVRGDANF